MHVDNGGDGQPVLYDPAGIPNSGEPRGSGDVFSGADANLSDYRNYHEAAGDTVEAIQLPTTPEQEAAIAKRAEEIGGATPGLCASAPSSAIGGVCGISPSFLPGSLGSEAKRQNAHK